MRIEIACVVTRDGACRLAESFECQENERLYRSLKLISGRS